MAKNRNNEELIKNTIEEIRFMIQMHGGDIEFIKYEDKYVYIKLLDACAGCGLQDMTIQSGIYELLKDQVPEIEGVINVDL